MQEFFAANSMYVVLAAALISWVGFFAYMLTIDKKLDKQEKDL